MRPLSSPVRDHRAIGRVQLVVGMVFVIFAGALNPIEAVFGLGIAMPVTAAILYFAVFRRVSRRLVRNPPPAPTAEREDPASFAQRMRWPVAGQVLVFLVLAATARAPGFVGGIAVGVGVALLLTARWLEHWENVNEVGLLYEPGGARQGRGGYYVARAR
jgi:drug/metabolite transporter (DMT)-like permease